MSGISDGFAADTTLPAERSADLRQLDPRLPIGALKPLREQVDSQLALFRLPAYVMGAFALLALLLAAALALFATGAWAGAGLVLGPAQGNKAGGAAGGGCGGPNSPRTRRCALRPPRG